MQVISSSKQNLSYQYSLELLDRFVITNLSICSYCQSFVNLVMNMLWFTWLDLAPSFECYPEPLSVYSLHFLEHHISNQALSVTIIYLCLLFPHLQKLCVVSAIPLTPWRRPECLRKWFWKEEGIKDLGHQQPKQLPAVRSSNSFLTGLFYSVKNFVAKLWIGCYVLQIDWTCYIERKNGNFPKLNL